MRLKYISAVIKSPEIRRKFNIFPTPKYLRIKKSVMPNEIKNPLLELANIVEKVKRRARKTKTKNPGTTKAVSGSTK